MGTMRNLYVRVTLCLGLVGACGGDVDYLDMPPGEAATELAELGCSIMFECGVIDFDTSTQPCAATYQPAESMFADEAECQGSLIQTYSDLFRGCAMANLTAAERDDLNACLNLEQGCLSEAELAALANGVCEGTPYGPEVCQRANVVFQRCFDCEIDPTDPQCTGG